VRGRVWWRRSHVPTSRMIRRICDKLSPFGFSSTSEEVEDRRMLNLPNSLWNGW
jgi:hypothetical protein